MPYGSLALSLRFLQILRCLKSQAPPSLGVFSVLQPCLWFPQQNHSHLRLLDLIIDLSEIGKRVPLPSTHYLPSFHWTRVCFSILTSHPLHFGLLQEHPINSIPSQCLGASQPIFFFYTSLTAKFHQLLSCNHLILSLLFYFWANTLV